jgi:hypothetical protein
MVCLFKADKRWLESKFIFILLENLFTNKKKLSLKDESSISPTHWHKT